MEQENVLKNHLINGRYQIQHKLDEGSFSIVYLGTDTLTKKKVAIKVESASYTKPTIPHESAIYRHLNNRDGFPQIFYAGQEKDHNILVMNVLGVSLKHVHDEIGKKFSLKTVVQLADQMLTRLETLHGLHFVHCDLKPANFMMGSGDKSNTVHLIDFGLARQYICDNKHVNNRNRNFVGNPAFAACNAHLKRSLARRDDLESLGYILIYFLKGTLPWETTPSQTLQEQFRQIQRIKLSTSTEMLCQGVSPVFLQYFHYVQKLKHEEKPNYDYLRQLFRNLAARLKYNYDNQFDWNKKITAKKVKGVPGPAQGVHAP
ncbi:Casein kinase Ialpha [Carabus blaptoides fortunei]